MDWITFLAEQRASVMSPYSLPHILLSLAIIASAFLFSCLFRRLAVRPVRLCLIFGILLALAELVKQLVLTKYLGYYSWMDFPFQLCSIPMYLCLLYPFYKKGRKCFEGFLSTFGLLGGIAALAEPSSSLTEVPFLTWHALLWHGILLFLGFYFAPRNKSGDFRRPFLFYLLLALTALLLNTALSFPSDETINMFFLGPNYPGIIGLIAIWEKLGWAVESAAMIFATVLGAWLIFQAELFFSRKKHDLA